MMLHFHKDGNLIKCSFFPQFCSTLLHNIYLLIIGRNESGTDGEKKLHVKTFEDFKQSLKIPY